MTHKYYWYAAKKRGYGAGLPISWQGWLLLVLFIFLLFIELLESFVVLL